MLQVLHAIKKEARASKTLAAQGFCSRSGVTLFVTLVTLLRLMVEKCYAPLGFSVTLVDSF